MDRCQTEGENIRWTLDCIDLLDHAYLKNGIHTNARHFRLGSDVSHEVKPIVFYSRKLNGHKKIYSHRKGAAKHHIRFEIFLNDIIRSTIENLY